MKILLDSHLLIWVASEPEKLSDQACRWLNDPANLLMFSAASLWELTIKQGLGRADFQVDVRRLRRGLLDAGYQELAVTSEHAMAVNDLPVIHRDPFDRMLVAQARVEGIALMSHDAQLAKYPGMTLLV